MFWSALIAVLTLGIYFFLVGVVDTPFERIVISLLVLLFLNLNIVFSLSSQFNGQFIVALQTEFLKIRELLNDKDLGEEKAQAASEKVRLALVTSDKANILNLIIFVIVLFSLIVQMLSV